MKEARSVMSHDCLDPVVFKSSSEWKVDPSRKNGRQLLRTAVRRYLHPSRVASAISGAAWDRRNNTPGTCTRSDIGITVWTFCSGSAGDTPLCSLVLERSHLRTRCSIKPTPSNESYLETQCPQCSSRTIVQRPEPKTDRVRCICNKCSYQWWVSDPTFTSALQEFKPGHRGLN